MKFHFSSFFSKKRSNERKTLYNCHFLFFRANNKKKPTNLVLGGSYDTIYRRRLSTEGSDAGGSSRGASGTTSPVTSSPARSPPYRQYEESKSKKVKTVRCAILDYDDVRKLSTIYG